ncbi:hypothetical protein ZWY2020_004494 [Hordeum vulgare]|nr:hypothetical protein ZWY2020_054553 [Hordeum vulgare]KAI4999905.1 hypothetical protein ZWY2020_004494 [Hordeum vulgare]
MAATASRNGGRAFTRAEASRVDEQSTGAWRRQRVSCTCCRTTECLRGDDSDFPRHEPRRGTGNSRKLGAASQLAKLQRTTTTARSVFACV